MEPTCSGASTSQPSSPSKPAMLVPTAADAEPGRDSSKASARKNMDLSSDFVNILSSRIDEIEKTMLSGGSNSEREVGKARKKALREVVKYVTDRANPVEEKISFLQGKYAQQVTELVRSEKQVLDLQKEVESLTKEKDKVQQELRKSNLLRDKLEELCRQLQRELRESHDEARRRGEEDLRARQALQAKFSAAIDDVNVKMDAQAAERLKQAEENEALRIKLGSFLEQFESFNGVLEKKELELQLANARYEQQAEINKQLSARSELLQKSNDEFMTAHTGIKKDLEMSLNSQAKVQVLDAQNKELKKQVEHYAGKFEEFQSSLASSNKLFEKLRGDMESGAKARSALAAERDLALKKAGQSDMTIVSLVRDRDALKKALAGAQATSGSGGEEARKLRGQKDALEGLCRALQAKLKAFESGATPEQASAAAAAAITAGRAQQLLTPADADVDSPADASGPAAQEGGSTGGADQGPGEAGGEAAHADGDAGSAGSAGGAAGGSGLLGLPESLD